MAETKNTEAIELIGRFRRGESGAAVALQSWAYEYVRRRFSGGLSRNGIHAIVNGAWTDLLTAFDKYSKWTDEEFFQVFRKALEKRRKSQKRFRNRQRERHPQLKGTEGLSSYTRRELEENIVTRDFLQKALDRIFEAFKCEIPKLRLRDRILVVAQYDLFDFFPVQSLDSVRFTSEDTRRRAISRARKRLAEATLKYLKNVLQEKPKDHEVLTLAVAIVQGDKILDARDLLGELDLGA